MSKLTDAADALAQSLMALGAPSVQIVMTPPETPTDALVDLNVAAAILGYKPAGLRKVVARSKAGKPGPTIQFTQVGKGPIRFRREWLDDFIASNIVKRPLKKLPKSKAKPKPVIEPQHGFDSRYFKR
jgi:hypothetical protein